MSRTSENEILGFIARFHQIPHSRIDEVFTSGCCYWFAAILAKRFPESEIIYDPVMNHFMTRIGGELYDITGRVCPVTPVIPWDSYPDPLERERIVQQCIDFRTPRT